MTTFIKKHRIGYKQTAVQLNDNTFAEQNFSVGVDEITTNMVAVSSTATKLADHDPTRVALLVTNVGSGMVFLGKAGVTPSTGFPVASGGTIRLETTAEVWVVTATGTANVHILSLSL